MFDEEKQMGAGFRQGTQIRACYLNDLRILDTENFIWSRLRISGTHCYLDMGILPIFHSQILWLLGDGL